MTTTLADRLRTFQSSLQAPAHLPAGVSVVPHPTNIASRDAFFQKYFSDNRQRVLILGINPGRLGSADTGIPFTDAQRLARYCDIESSNPIAGKPSSDQSSAFIYKVIEAMGGPSHFYASFLIGSVCPIGFIREGRNLNYYDMPDLLDAMRDTILHGLREQAGFGVASTVVILGVGKNLRAFEQLNSEANLFRRVVALEHPRFIMQYDRAKLADHVASYSKLLVKVRREAGSRDLRSLA